MLSMLQDKYAHIYNKVKEGMEMEQWFLRADLSLKTLSRVVGTNTVYLSKAINQGFECSYSTLLNQYRLDFLINEAMKSDDSIEDISARYNFWSRSTLYDVFRQFKGVSPSRYIEEKRMNQRNTKFNNQKTEN